jgi:hypothetical protein
LPAQARVDEHVEREMRRLDVDEVELGAFFDECRQHVVRLAGEGAVSAKPRDLVHDGT